MDKNELFYASIATSLIGFTLIGLGLGKLFNEIWVGILVGLGIGMIITAILLLRTSTKLGAKKDASEVDEKNKTITLPEKSEG